jgi:hypothetical protein
VLTLGATVVPDPGGRRCRRHNNWLCGFRLHNSCLHGYRLKDYGSLGLRSCQDKINKSVSAYDYPT